MTDKIVSPDIDLSASGVELAEQWHIRSLREHAQAGLRKYYAATRCRQRPGSITGWFEDYNDNHPHPGLTMRSPREFIAAQTATA